MKKLLGIVVLGLLLTLSAKADDIRDFEIEGMSIGDSLLDYVSEGEIKKFRTSQTSGSKKYKRYYEVKEVNNYDGIDVWVLDNDSKFIIKSLTGFIEYTNNIVDCYPKKKDIVSTIESQINIKSHSYISKYDNNTSRSDVTDFDLKNGSIRIWCTDYSQKKEEKGYGDFLGVTASSAQFLYWIDNEAYQ